MSRKFNVSTLLNLIVLLSCLEEINSNPAIATGYDPLEVCFENCAQCKKMYGLWFDGALCAQYCIKMKGKFIAECEDFGSIAPFLNKL